MENNNRILKTDNPYEMASKIFKHFAVNQSCTIKGFDLSDTENFKAIGEKVIDRLMQFDKEENCYVSTTGKERRRYTTLKDNHIGGYKAGKIFRYEINTDYDTSIWRVQ